MSVSAKCDELVLGIVGAGAMGRGIAQIASLAGIEVRLHDNREGASEEACVFVTGMINRLAEKGKITSEMAAVACARLQVANALQDLAICTVVVEAIVEDLSIKHNLFQTLEEIVTPDCLLATNTSSLSVTAIAAACKYPERVGGFHFFNPVPLMKVVEVIDGFLTAPCVGERLTSLAQRMGHQPVRAKDTPGFIVNHAGRGYVTEAFRLLGESVAEFYEIDRILRDAAGFRMGPFELMDLTGLDVTHPVIESIYHQYYQDPRYRPSPLAQQRVTAGVLGRKTGQGFYRYQNQQAEEMPTAPLPAERPAKVWVSRSCADTHEALTYLIMKLGGVVDTDVQPAPESLCLVAPLGIDATTAALAEDLDPARTMAIDTLFGFEKRRTLMATPVTCSEMRRAAHGLLGSDGIPVSVIRDSTGFVAQRVLASIVNIACDMAQQEVATPEDIDRAVTLGLGYPKGPLTFGDYLGPDKILKILQNIFMLSGDPRYRPSPWLQRRAQLNVSLLTHEGR